MGPTELHAHHRLLMDPLEERIGGQDYTKLSETPRQKPKPKSLENPAVPGSIQEPPGPFLTKAPQGLLPADP